MKKKILLAGGCSYTDPNFRSDAIELPDEQRSGWPMWPELMGRELDLRVINTAHSGRGNQWIAKTIISNIIKYGDQIDTVAILWTGADRIEHYNWTVHPLLDCYGNEPLATEHGVYCGLNELKWTPGWFKDNSVYQTWFRDSLLAMYNVAEICQSRGITCQFGQGVSFFLYQVLEVSLEVLENMPKSLWTTTWENMRKNLLQYTELDFINMIENGHFCKGEIYPIAKELKKKFKNNFIRNTNRFSQYEFTASFDFGFHEERNVYRISDNKNMSNKQVTPYDVNKHDYHPNALGQKYMAETYISHYYKKLLKGI